MSPAASVKTFKIDGRDFSARADETILDVARENNIFVPRMCELEGLSTVGACRLCLVEVKGIEQAAAGMRHTRRRGHGGYHQLRSPRSLSQDDRRVVVHRGQPHLFGVRLQRPLRAAEHGAEAGHRRTSIFPYRYPKKLSRCLARTFCARSKSLHSVHALRSRVR